MPLSVRAFCWHVCYELHFLRPTPTFVSVLKKSGLRMSKSRLHRAIIFSHTKIALKATQSLSRFIAKDSTIQFCIMAPVLCAPCASALGPLSPVGIPSGASESVEPWRGEGLSWWQPFSPKHEKWKWKKWKWKKMKIKRRGKVSRSIIHCHVISSSRWHEIAHEGLILLCLVSSRSSKLYMIRQIAILEVSWV